MKRKFLEKGIKPVTVIVCISVCRMSMFLFVVCVSMYMRDCLCVCVFSCVYMFMRDYFCVCARVCLVSACLLEITFVCACVIEREWKWTKPRWKVINALLVFEEIIIGIYFSKILTKIKVYLVRKYILFVRKWNEHGDSK